jgi:mono/diheme cytochrome c family protein
MARFLWGVAFTILLLAGGLALLVSLGGINMAATEEPGAMETKLAGWTVERSVAARAPQGSNPLAGDPEAIDAGLVHYRAMCVHCHATPQVEASEFAAGMNPPPPDLSIAAQEWTDGELFWIARHGIRMTGMPAFGQTHSDEDLWKIVAFLRQLDSLSEEQVAALSEGTPADRLAEARGQHAHGHGENSDPVAADQPARSDSDSTKIR